MVFSEETASAIERHALVRGGPASLEAAQPCLVGARSSETGFEGLTDQAEGLAGIEGLVLERASLEDIVVYSTREDYRARVGA